MGHTISQWEAAIRKRRDIEFSEMYLKEGMVRTVIGFIQYPSRRKSELLRPRRVRWNSIGECLTPNGERDENLVTYNIFFR